MVACNQSIGSEREGGRERRKEREGGETRKEGEREEVEEEERSVSGGGHKGGKKERTEMTIACVLMIVNLSGTTQCHQWKIPLITIPIPPIISTPAVQPLYPTFPYRPEGEPPSDCIVRAPQKEPQEQWGRSLGVLQEGDDLAFKEEKAAVQGVLRVDFIVIVIVAIVIAIVVVS